ncbi:MAG: glycosyltransferase [Candidatus Bathyarchaeia archaeon]
MRLFFVIRNSPFEPQTGTEVFIHNLARQLARVDVETGLIYAGTAPSGGMSDGVDYHPMTTKTTPLLSTLDFARSMAFCATRIISRDKPDVVVAAAAGTFGGLVFRALRDTKCMFYAMDSMPVEYQRMVPELRMYPPGYRLRNLVDHAFFSVVEWWAVRSSDHVLASSSDTRSSIVSRYRYPPSNVSVVYEGIPSNYASGMASYQPRTPVFLHVGGGARKGTSYFVKALGLLRAEFKVAAKGIITRADFLAKQTAELQSNIQVFEWLDNDSLKKLYASCTALVAPSMSEGFCLPVIEAAAFGKPSIVSDAGSLPELVTDSRNGIVVSPITAANLAKAMYQLSVNPAMAESMGREALARLDSFTLESCARRFLDIIERHS